MKNMKKVLEIKSKIEKVDDTKYKSCIECGLAVDINDYTAMIDHVYHGSGPGHGADNDTDAKLKANYLFDL